MPTSSSARRSSCGRRTPIGRSGARQRAPIGRSDAPNIARGLCSSLDVRGIYADDDHAAVILHETASRPDGASIAMDEVHVLRLRDGKVLDLWDLPEDIQEHDDFFDGK